MLDLLAAHLIVTETLQKVQAWLLEAPDLYDQETWGQPVDMPLELEPYATYAPCHTVACIAGDYALMRGWRLKCDRDWQDTSGVPHMSPENAFEKDLDHVVPGLLGSPGFTLFNPSESWPQPFASAFAHANTEAERAAVACRRIDYFLETGW